MKSDTPAPHIGWWLLRHVLGGFAIGASLGLAVIAFDIGQIRTLAVQQSSGIALFALCLLCGFTCGAAQMGIAVMALADDDDK
jgi:hypothetical protein